MFGDPSAANINWGCLIGRLPSRVKDNNGSVQSRVLSNILGVNTAGEKDLIGIYLSDNECVIFWLSVLADLEQRGWRISWLLA